MEELSEPELKFVAVNKRRPFILFRAWQWVIAAFFVIVVLMLLSNVVKMSAPGAPNVLFFYINGACCQHGRSA